MSLDNIIGFFFQGGRRIERREEQLAREELKEFNRMLEMRKGVGMLV